MLINDKKYVSVRFSEPQLKERNRPLSIIFEVSNFLSTTRNAQEILNGALTKVLEYFNLDVGRIYLMEDDKRTLSLAAHIGVETGGLEKVRVGEGFSGLSALTRSFIAQNVSELEDKTRSALLESKGLRIVFCVPLIAMDQVVGVMNLAARTIIEFEHRDIDLLISIGNLVAVALNNARLYQDVDAKVKELKLQKDAIEFFAYSISHDLKSPAVGIYGLTRKLHKQYCELLGEHGKRFCEAILKGAEQIVRLVDRINAYIMCKEAQLHFEAISVKELTEVIRDEFAEAMNRRNVRWQEPDSFPSIIADKISVTRVLRNLVDNALKYGGEGLTEIRIEYRGDPEYHIVSVSDDGVGLKVEDSEKLFLLFHRNRTSSGIEGTGLGLAAVKEIAERHQGRVWMESGAEGGTTFFVSFSKMLRAQGQEQGGEGDRSEGLTAY